MKTHALLTAVAISLSMVSSGQKFEKLKNFPDSVYWNLDSNARDELTLSNHQLPIPESWNVWKKPEDIKAVLRVVKFQELELNNSSDMKALFAKAKTMGLYPCPAWVVVQVFLETGYKGRAVWFPLEEMMVGEIPRIGCKGSHANTTNGCTGPELFSGDPRGILSEDFIVFMKK